MSIAIGGHEAAMISHMQLSYDVRNYLSVSGGTTLASW